MTEILGAFYKANAPLSRRRWAVVSFSASMSETLFRVAGVRGGSEW